MGIFVVEIDGRPALAINARCLDEAQSISALPDLRDDLCALTADGVPLCSPDSVIVTRQARTAEIDSYRVAQPEAENSDELTFVFLVKVDGIVVAVVGDQ